VDPLRLAFPLEFDPRVFAREARDHGWAEIEGGRGDDENRPAWRYQVPGGELTFVDDTVVGVQYVAIAAEPPAPIREAIEVESTAYDRAECVDLLDLGEREAKVINCLKLLAVTAPGPFDQRLFDGVVAALRDEREEVRYWALKVPDYTEWPQFLPAVRELATADPRERIRRFAGNTRLLLEAVTRAAGS
jgi:hypothetical protein